MEVNKSDTNNKIDTEKIGMEQEKNNFPLLRKRSSLKPRSSLKDGGLKIDNNLGLKRKISFHVDANEDDFTKSEKSYSDSKTRFSSAVNKLTKFNYIYHLSFL